MGAWGFRVMHMYIYTYAYHTLMNHYLKVPKPQTFWGSGFRVGPQTLNPNSEAYEPCPARSASILPGESRPDGGPHVSYSLNSLKGQLCRGL